MRILMVARRFPPDVRSGTETVFERLWAEARRAGHEVRLVVGYRTSPEGFPPDAVAVDLRTGGPRAYLSMARAAEREVREFRPDAVLSNSVEVVPRGAPCALIVHDLNFGKDRRDLTTPLREQLYRLQGRRAARVVAVSAHTRVRLLDVGLEDARVVVIGNGVDTARFVPRDAPEVLAQPPAGMKAAPSPLTRFVYPARMIPGKGQHAAIDALGRMRPDQRWRAELTLVGAAADRIYVDKLRVQAFNLPVRIVTDVPDIVPFYQGADVVLFPTLMEEGFGFTALEGMACGKPVLFYDQPAVREATGGEAVAVPRDDATALRDAMLRLMDDPAERSRLGAAGRAWAERRDWSRVWQDYAAVLGAIR